MNALALAALSTEIAPQERIVAQAVVRAMSIMGIRQAELAAILGVSPAHASRLVAGERVLPAAGKPFELAVLLIRLFRGLSGMFGDDATTRAWLRLHNTVLDAAPIDLIRTARGLVETIQHVDSRRAPLRGAALCRLGLAHRGKPVPPGHHALGGFFGGSAPAGRPDRADQAADPIGAGRP